MDQLDSGKVRGTLNAFQDLMKVWKLWKFKY